MKIKIRHGENYIIYSFDIENEEALIIENNSNDLLDNIFDYFGVKAPELSLPQLRQLAPAYHRYAL